MCVCDVYNYDELVPLMDTDSVDKKYAVFTSFAAQPSIPNSRLYEIIATKICGPKSLR